LSKCSKNEYIKDTRRKTIKKDSCLYILTENLFKKQKGKNAMARIREGTKAPPYNPNI